MLQLNLPLVQFRIKERKNGYLIFDNFRKKYVKLTPEEWVRQHFLTFLVDNKGYPSGLLAVEQEMNINGMKKRCDAILYDLYAQPQLIIELKAPHVPITQAVFDQVAVYNSKLNVAYFMISNGIEHYCCRVNSEDSSYVFLENLPDYDEFNSL